jgi:pSer/pThr/pTyr-binding forkhead associated (FHA) protein
MSINCPVCGYDKTPINSEFCDACGAELSIDSSQKIEELPIEINSEITPNFEPEISLDLSKNISNEPPLTNSNTTLIGRLIAKQNNPPIPEFTLEEFNIIGIFDPDTGPVEIDLENFLGSETVSRQHAEIYQENGAWKIKDVGSTNGVFIKPIGEKRFHARITSPTIINHGDEISIAKVRFLFQTS